MKLVLKRPIRVGEKGEPITELIFRERLCAGDMRGLKLRQLGADPSVDDYLTIGGRLCGRTDAEMSDLSEDDFAAMVELIVGFRAAGPKT